MFPINPIRAMRFRRIIKLHGRIIALQDEFGEDSYPEIDALIENLTKRRDQLMKKAGMPADQLGRLTYTMRRG